MNDSRQRGADWWEWSVWVAGRDDAVGRIKEVVYRLHPTFINPTRVVTDRDSAFKLSSEGWGEFSISAHVRNENGSVVRLRRWIQFGDSKRGSGRTTPPVPVVTERRFIDPVIVALKSQGIEVVSPQELTGDQPLAESPSDDVTRVNLVAISSPASRGRSRCSARSGRRRSASTSSRSCLEESSEPTPSESAS